MYSTRAIAALHVTPMLCLLRLHLKIHPPLRFGSYLAIRQMGWLFSWTQTPFQQRYQQPILLTPNHRGQAFSFLLAVVASFQCMRVSEFFMSSVCTHFYFSRVGCQEVGPYIYTSRGKGTNCQKKNRDRCSRTRYIYVLWQFPGSQIHRDGRICIVWNYEKYLMHFSISKEVLSLAAV